jgi:hypothetical protein
LIFGSSEGSFLSTFSLSIPIKQVKIFWTTTSRLKPLSRSWPFSLCVPAWMFFTFQGPMTSLLFLSFSLFLGLGCHNIFSLLLSFRFYQIRTCLVRHNLFTVMERSSLRREFNEAVLCFDFFSISISSELLARVFISVLGVCVPPLLRLIVSGKSSTVWYFISFVLLQLICFLYLYISHSCCSCEPNSFIITFCKR